jgi:hypothetical protein
MPEPGRSAELGLAVGVDFKLSVLLSLLFDRVETMGRI